jgi:hypothetical protein
MKLPNAEHAIIEREKVANYLLNSGHPDNGGKAPYFEASGFHRDGWHVFAEALRSLAITEEITKSLDSPHGMKYILDGEIETPAGRRASLRTIWILDFGSDTPRLVTAYPHEK